MLGLEYSVDVDVERLFGKANNFDFMYDNKCISYDLA